MKWILRKEWILHNFDTKLQIELSTLCRGKSYSKTLSALVDISLLWNLFSTRRFLKRHGTQIQVHFHVLFFLLLLAC